MAKLKRNLVISAVGVIVVGGSFFVGSYFARPAVAAQSVSLQETQSQQEVEQLKKEVVLLPQESSSASSSSSASEESPAAKQPVVVQISEPPVPAVSASSHASQPTASSSAAPAKPAKVENAGTVFEGYTVTVTDTTTLAEMALGRDWPITKLYFLDANGDSLGSISGTAYSAIIDKYKTHDTWDAPGANGAWEFWFAEKFNEYRGLSGNSSNGSNGNQSGGGHASGGAKEVDIDEYANEVITLINQKREDKGLNTLDVDSDLMSHSQVRAEELSTQYSHVRPDGTKEKSECIVMRRDTPSAAVQAWMDSDPHRDAILNESGRFRYQYIGSGCYQDEKGVLYWVITFGV